MKGLLIFFILLLILLILTFPVKVKAAVHINVLEDVGFGAIKLMHLKLFCAKFRISREGKFEVDSALKKKKKKKKKIIRQKYFECMAKLIEVKKFEVFLDSGSTYNAYVISMLCGYISALTSQLIALLINKYKKIKVFSFVKPVFEEDRLEVSGSLVIAFTLLDMAISIIYAHAYYFIEIIKEKIECKKKTKLTR